MKPKTMLRRTHVMGLKMVLLYCVMGCVLFCACRADDLPQCVEAVHRVSAPQWVTLFFQKNGESLCANEHSSGRHHYIFLAKTCSDSPPVQYTFDQEKRIVQRKKGQHLCLTFPESLLGKKHVWGFLEFQPCEKNHELQVWSINSQGEIHPTFLHGEQFGVYDKSVRKWLVISNDVSGAHAPDVLDMAHRTLSTWGNPS